MNNLRVIRHKKENGSETAFCRVCGLIYSGNNALNIAKKHSKDTGHTVDIYYETWR